MAKVKILIANAGLLEGGALVSYTPGEIVEVTQRLADFMECAVRAGHAIYLDDEKKKTEDPPVTHEDPDVHNSPPVRAGSRRGPRKPDRTGS